MNDNVDTSTLRQENERLQSELDNLKAAKAGLDCWAETTRKKVLELEGENKALKSELEKVRSQLSQVPAANSSAPGLDLPEASDLLNRLKAKRKTSKVTLADVEAVLELLDP